MVEDRHTSTWGNQLDNTTPKQISECYYQLPIEGISYIRSLKFSNIHRDKCCCFSADGLWYTRNQCIKDKCVFLKKTTFGLFGSSVKVNDLKDNRQYMQKSHVLYKWQLLQRFTFKISITHVFCERIYLAGLCVEYGETQPRYICR